jgi:hypothetical protein
LKYPEWSMTNAIAMENMKDPWDVGYIFLRDREPVTPSDEPSEPAFTEELVDYDTCFLITGTCSVNGKKRTVIGKLRVVGYDEKTHAATYMAPEKENLLKFILRKDVHSRIHFWRCDELGISRMTAPIGAPV